MAEKRPFRIVLGQGPQKGMLGGSLSRYVPPGAQYDYQPPSVFVRYRVVTVVFALLAAAMLVSLFAAPHHQRPRNELPGPPLRAPSPAQQADPVYVTPLPPRPIS